MHTLSLINTIIAIVFTLCYCYQFIYIPIVWFKPKRTLPESTKKHHFAVLICARNEENVIADLIHCLKKQNYPQDLIKIFVMADNCTDHTPAIARKAGAKVYTRFNHKYVGKGYALNDLLKCIKRDYPSGFHGYFVFDADNLLDPNFISKMNDTFSQGHDIITSYRNSKNYDANWISSGYALWFLRESRYLSHARFLIGSSCAVSGTGFFFSQKIADEMQGWPFHMLTEDIEFSIHQIIKGRKIAFCPEAELYDEQPVTFSQSWTQRLRWSKGYLQVFRGYGKQLIHGTFQGRFSCFDMSMTILPAFVLSVISLICNVVLGIWGAAIGDDIMIAVHSIGGMFYHVYITLSLIGLITILTEWKHIQARAYRKILSVFTFPLFMLTYVPISFAAFFCKVSWKPIKHTYSADKLAKRKI